MVGRMDKKDDGGMDGELRSRLDRFKKKDTVVFNFCALRYKVV
jgi:hypothetical protein